MPLHSHGLGLTGPAATGRGGRPVVYPLRTMSTWKDALMKAGECPQPTHPADDDLATLELAA
jgi:hypothetical protein